MPRAKPARQKIRQFLSLVSGDIGIGVAGYVYFRPPAMSIFGR